MREKCEGKTIQLGEKEHRVLKALLTFPNQALSREQLIEVAFRSDKGVSAIRALSTACDTILEMTPGFRVSSRPFEVWDICWTSPWKKLPSRHAHFVVESRYWLKPCLSGCLPIIPPGESTHRCRAIRKLGLRRATQAQGRS